MAVGRGSTAAGRDYSVQALAPRLFLTVFHLTAVGVAGWLLFGGGLENSTAVPLRRDLLFACAILYFLRVILTSFYLMKRRMGWGEATLIAVWVSAIHLLFAYLGGTHSGPVGTAAVAGTMVYIAGSLLNTGSELQRRKWKQQPENAGHLFYRRPVPIRDAH